MGRRKPKLMLLRMQSTRRRLKQETTLTVSCMTVRRTLENTETRSLRPNNRVLETPWTTSERSWKVELERKSRMPQMSCNKHKSRHLDPSTTNLLEVLPMSKHKKNQRMIHKTQN